MPDDARVRVVVIGGHGHLGAAIVSALRAAAGFEVAIAGRSADVHIDLHDADTFAALAGFDAIVNASDTLRAPPDALVRHCLERGQLLLETAAEPVFVRRVLAADLRAGPGTVVLGAGLFPGLSNLLAADTAARVEACTSLELAIRWSPFSGGGGGMVALVPHLIRVPTQHRAAGRMIEGSPVESGPVLPFSDGEHASLHVAFSEPSMLARSLDVPNVAVYGSFVPDVVMASFRFTPLWLLALAPVRAWLWLQFTILRRFLLRRVPADVRMVARARAADGREALARLHVRDGIAACGWAIVGALRHLADHRPPPGLVLPDRAMRLDDVLVRIPECPPDALPTIECSGPTGP